MAAKKAQAVKKSGTVKAKGASKAKSAPPVKVKSGGKAQPAPAKRAGAMAAGPAEGQSAPDFALTGDDGRQYRLADFRGRDLILYFYPKDQTPGCTTEACDFRDNLARLAKAGAAVLGVSADSVDSHKRFKAKQGLNFPLLSDPDHKALGAYGVWKEKSLYGRKFMGIERTTFLIGGDGKVRKIFPKVKVAGHADQVLAALAEPSGRA